MGYFQYMDGQGGAYCLVETGPAVPLVPPQRLSHIVGPLFSQVTQTTLSSNGLQQWVRLFNGSDVVEVEHSSGRLGEGRELISRFDTSIDNQGMIFTDDSGFPEMHARPLNRSGPISQN